MKKIYLLNLLFVVAGFYYCSAQGTWTQIYKLAPDTSAGTMLLLSDGSVITKTKAGGPSGGYGTIWDRLTPDSTGSYLNGTWSKIAAMNYDRLYFSSQVLKDGRVYVAGGEYGGGQNYAETYDPISNAWTMCPNLGTVISDANSEILENGNVLQAYVTSPYTGTYIYNPLTNKYNSGPSASLAFDESAWVKLPDNSILFSGLGSSSSQRYIPAMNKWVNDANLPASLYDPYGESGAGFLLPNGKAFFIGALGNTAIYTPSGNSNPGTWVAASNIPDSASAPTLGAPDAPGAMLVNGKILCALGPLPTTSNQYPKPTYFYEYDYLTNTFTQVNAPVAGKSSNASTFSTTMLDLPNGSVMYVQYGSKKFYTYTPVGAPLAAWKPTIDSVIPNSQCDTFKITGTQFNGISEGAAYGDDEQMSTNYPIIRLTSGANVYYARTFNWNSTGVQRGNKPDTTLFTLPAALPAGTYSLVVTANGIASDPVSFIYPCDPTLINEPERLADDNISVYPNPAKEQLTISFRTNEGGNYLIKMLDVVGRTIKEESGEAIPGGNTHVINLNGISKGIYLISVQSNNHIFKTTKFVVE